MKPIAGLTRSTGASNPPLMAVQANHERLSPVVQILQNFTL
ncbi:MAG TPA: hypothetical protein V6C78_35015 [Crinalium sp.]